MTCLCAIATEPGAAPPSRPWCAYDTDSATNRSEVVSLTYSIGQGKVLLGESSRFPEDRMRMELAKVLEVEEVGQ